MNKFLYYFWNTNKYALIFREILHFSTVKAAADCGHKAHKFCLAINKRVIRTTFTHPQYESQIKKIFYKKR